MNRLIELYCRSQGEAAKEHGKSWNGPCPLCGGKDRFIIWPEREENLGETCAQHGIKGIWSCRQCGKSGDTIAYLMEAEGLSFKEACADLGLEPTSKKPRRTPTPPRKVHPAAFQPRTTSAPCGQWQEYAAKLLAEAREALPSSASAIAWLAKRGIDREAGDRYQLGYLPGEGNKSGRYRDRGALGLSPTKTGRDGKERRTIFIPRGIVIPAFDSSGRIVRLRIRRPKPDVQVYGDKYMVLEGSGTEPLMLKPSSGSRHLAVYCIVEAELDAMLIHHVTGGQVGAFAALTNLGKPNAAQHWLLKEAARLLVALDYDEPKPVTKPDGSQVLESAGANGWAWWKQTYSNSHRWPVPSGKDPGEAFERGVDLRAWVAAGLPPSLSLNRALPQAGGLGGFAPGPVPSGGKGKAGAASADTEQGKEAAAPPPDGSLGAKLRELVDLIAAVPGFQFIKEEDSFHFRHRNGWARASMENWEQVLRVQREIMRDKEIWDYLLDHPASSITAENLLQNGV